MSKQKKQPEATGRDRHKPARMFRIPAKMAELFDELGEEEIGTNAAEHLRNAAREYLIRKGKIKRPEA